MNGGSTNFSGLTYPDELPRPAGLLLGRRVTTLSPAGMARACRLSPTPPAADCPSGAAPRGAVRASRSGDQGLPSSSSLLT